MGQPSRWSKFRGLYIVIDWGPQVDIRLWAYLELFGYILTVRYVLHVRIVPIEPRAASDFTRLFFPIDCISLSLINQDIIPTTVYRHYWRLTCQSTQTPSLSWYSLWWHAAVSHSIYSTAHRSKMILPVPWSPGTKTAAMTTGQRLPCRRTSDERQGCTAAMGSGRMWARRILVADSGCT